LRINVISHLTIEALLLIIYESLVESTQLVCRPSSQTVKHKISNQFKLRNADSNLPKKSFR